MPKTYTAAGSATAGDVYTASAHNVIVTDVNNLIVPPACKAVRATSQTITTATTTAIQFNAPDEFDTDSMHDTVTNNTRVTVNTAGLYVISAGLNWSGASTTGNYRLMGIRKNGTTEIAYMNMTGAAAGSDPRHSLTTVDFASLASDYYELTCYHDRGSDLGLSVVSGFTAYLSIVWVGRTS